MPERRFAPGFRISVFDAAILFCGVTGTAAAGARVWVGGLIVGFAVGHFFLFCNVFRIRRRPELIWAGTFIGLTAVTLFTGFPGWMGTIAGSLALTVFLVMREMKQPYYHGVGWSRINPGLRNWWEANARS